MESMRKKIIKMLEVESKKHTCGTKSKQTESAKPEIVLNVVTPNGKKIKGLSEHSNTLSYTKEYVKFMEELCKKYKDKTLEKQYEKISSYWHCCNRIDGWNLTKNIQFILQRHDVYVKDVTHSKTYLVYVEDKKRWMPCGLEPVKSFMAYTEMIFLQNMSKTIDESIKYLYENYKKFLEVFIDNNVLVKKYCVESRPKSIWYTLISRCEHITSQLQYLNKLRIHVSNYKLDETLGDKLDRKLKLLPLANGLTLDFSDPKKINVRPRIKEDYFTYELDLKYIPEEERDLTVVNKYLKDLFNDYSNLSEEEINKLCQQHFPKHRFKGDEYYSELGKDEKAQIDPIIKEETVKIRAIRTQEKRDYVLNVFAYMLTPLTNKKCYWYFYGGTNSGKSLLATSIIKKIFGKLCATAPSNFFALGKFSNSSGHSADLEHLRNSYMVCTDELKRYFTIDEQKIKRFTGGSQTFTSRGLHQGFSEYKNKSKLLFLSNFMPKVTDDIAHGKRMRVIPFETQYHPRKKDLTKENYRLQDDNIAYQMEQPENLNTFFSMLADRTHKIYHCGDFKCPKFILDYTSEIFGDSQLSNVYTMFIKDCIIHPCKLKNKKDGIKCSELYVKIKQYAQNNNLKFSDNNFTIKKNLLNNYDFTHGRSNGAYFTNVKWKTGFSQQNLSQLI